MRTLPELIQTQIEGPSLIVSIIKDDEKVGEFALERGSNKQLYTIIGANIEPEYRGKGLYKQALLDLIKQKGVIICSVFRSTEAERAWDSLLKTLPSELEFKKVKQDGEIVIYLGKRGSLTK